MKVLLVTESYWPNADGGALFERRLVLGLIEQGHTVQVWAPAKNFHSYVEKDGSSVIHRERAVTLIFNRKYKVSFWPFRHGKKIIRDFSPDVVHIHNPAFLGRTAMKYSNKHNIPVVATNHLMPENLLLNLKWTKSMSSFLYPKIWHYLVKFHNRAQFVTTPTPTALNFLKKYGLRAPSKAITNGIDTKIFRPGISSNAVRQKYQLKDLPTLLYLGRVDGEKRIDIILQAVAEIHKTQPVQLVIAGFGTELKALKQLAQDLKIKDSVIFTGFLDESDKPALYNTCDIFVISSPAELQSIVTLEAMACAKPILAVDVAALHELVTPGKNGYLFAENDYHSLAEEALRLIKEPEKAKKFGQASHEIIAKHHSTSVTFSQYEAAYRQAMK